MRRSHEGRDVAGEGVGGEGARGHDGERVFGNAQDFRPVETHLGHRRDGLGDAAGEKAAIHREGAASRHLHLVGHPHHERAHPTHLFLEQPRGLVEAVATQAVRADELGEVAGLVHGGAADRTHLVEVDRDAASRQLRRRLATREARSHDGDARAHEASIAPAPEVRPRRA